MIHCSIVLQGQEQVEQVVADGLELGGSQQRAFTCTQAGVESRTRGLQRPAALEGVDMKIPIHMRMWDKNISTMDIYLPEMGRRRASVPSSWQLSRVLVQQPVEITCTPGDQCMSRKHAGRMHRTCFHCSLAS